MKVKNNLDTKLVESIVSSNISKLKKNIKKSTTLKQDIQNINIYNKDSILPSQDTNTPLESVENKNLNPTNKLNHKLIYDLYFNSNLSLTDISQKLNYPLSSVWSVIARAEVVKSASEQYRNSRNDILAFQQLENLEAQQMISSEILRRISEKSERDLMTMRDLTDAKRALAYEFKHSYETERSEMGKAINSVNNFFAVLIKESKEERKKMLTKEVVIDV